MGEQQNKGYLSMKQKYKGSGSKQKRMKNVVQKVLQQQSCAYLSQQIYSRFENFLSNQKLKKLKVALDNYIGRNTPIIYFREYNFLQQWQTQKKPPQSQPSDILHTRNLYIELIALVIMLGYGVLVWLISYQLVFKSTEITQILSLDVIGLLIVMIHSVLKLVINCVLNKSYLPFVEIVKLYLVDLLTIVYFGIRIAMINNSQWIPTTGIIFIDVMLVLLCYKRASAIYKSFRMRVITSIYKDVFNLFDLLATLMTVAHIFALMLFMAARVNQNSMNWVKMAQIQLYTALQLYIYSLYFACTTMLTVGYGDLRPTNVIEIMAVLVIQIFGIAIFAYIINQIGHTLSSMRKQSETLEKDLSSLRKVAKYYALDEELQIKARAYIIDNQKSFNQLLPQEERELLMKLNDDLRTQINQENSLKIIKSSCFFICHWSKKLQYQIAKKLTKKLYSPNQKLIQPTGRQSIYVIKRGKVNIYTDRQSGLKRHFKKLLKTILIQKKQTVSNNIYGYTSVIASRPIRLNAVTKDFTVVYSIQKNDFIQSVVENQLDFQYFHQIKSKVDAEKLPEVYEAPSILNIRQHYSPSILFLIKKNAAISQQNPRIPNFRDSNRRMKLMLYECIEQLQGEMEYSLKSSRQRKQSLDMLKTKTYSENVLQRQNIMDEVDIKRNLHYLFDAGKQYQNYFKRFNKSAILWQHDNVNWGMAHVKAGGLMSYGKHRNVEEFQISLQ